MEPDLFGKPIKHIDADRGSRKELYVNQPRARLPSSKLLTVCSTSLRRGSTPLATVPPC